MRGCEDDVMEICVSEVTLIYCYHNEDVNDNTLQNKMETLGWVIVK